jgi:exopolysaccharide biosynthesis polyprenyl glycosylphosphotransferase
VPTAPPVSTGRPDLKDSPPPSADVRSSRFYLLSRGHLAAIMRRSLSVLALVTLDVLGLALGIYVALVLRSVAYGRPVYWSLLWREGPQEWLKFLAPVLVLVFLQAGLYAARERRAGVGSIVSSLVVLAIIVLAFGFGTSYDFTTTGLIPTAVVTSALTIGLLRAAYGSLSLEAMRVAGVQRRVVLAGEGESLRRLQRELGASRVGIAYDFVGVVSASSTSGAPVLARSLDEVPDVLEQVRPDELILAEGDFDETQVLEVVQVAHRKGVRVRLAPETTDLLVQKGEYVTGLGLPLFELRPPILTGWDWFVKRAFDVAFGVVVVVVGMPLWLLIALAIKLDSRGPIFYVDRRVGVREREFGMLKFRTMVVDAAQQQGRLEEENEAGGALFKIRDDPRVTSVGRILRRLSLDEIPQLLNVLRGQMSLVGPRPLPLRDYHLLEDWHRARYLVLPGMTGLWQISGRSGLSFEDLVRLDFTYIENWSIWLDISIIARTIPAVIAGRGAY